MSHMKQIVGSLFGKGFELLEEKDHHRGVALLIAHSCHHN